MARVERSDSSSVTPLKRKNNHAPTLATNQISDSHMMSASPQNMLVNLDLLSPVDQNGSFAFDRVIKSGKVLRRVKKKGAWKPSWKPAYLVLRPNLLSVYKKHDETGLRASVILSEVTAVAPVQKTNTDHVFGVFSAAKNFHFAGSTARESADWISALRSETHTEEQGSLEPPNPGFHQVQNAGYETTDVSAEEDTEAARSPETTQRSFLASSPTVDSRQYPSRSRRTSNVHPDSSGNEHMTASYSDFSDILGTSAPGQRSAFPGSGSRQTSVLSPIVDASTPARPVVQRNLSQQSDLGEPVLGKSPSMNDPSRVVRHGRVHLLKTVSGVKQWKSVWIVLRAQSLGLYKSSDEYAPLRVIPMYSIIDAAEIDPIGKSKPHCFQVISEDKTYKLSVEREEELEGWLGAFKSVLSRREAERNSRAVNGQKQTPTKPVEQPTDDFTTITTGMDNLKMRPETGTVKRASFGDQLVKS